MDNFAPSTFTSSTSSKSKIDIKGSFDISKPIEKLIEDFLSSKSSSSLNLFFNKELTEKVISPLLSQVKDNIKDIKLKTIEDINLNQIINNAIKDIKIDTTATTNLAASFNKKINDITSSIEKIDSSLFSKELNTKLFKQLEIKTATENKEIKIPSFNVEPPQQTDKNFKLDKKTNQPNIADTLFVNSKQTNNLENNNNKDFSNLNKSIDNISVNISHIDKVLKEEILGLLKEQKSKQEEDSEEVGLTDKNKTFLINDISLKIIDENQKKTLNSLDLLTNNNFYQLKDWIENQNKNFKELFKELNTSIANNADKEDSNSPLGGLLDMFSFGKKNKNKKITRSAKASKKISTKSATKTTAKPATKTATKTTAKPATKTATKTTAKTTTKAASKTAAKTATKTATKTAAKATTKAVGKTAAKTATKAIGKTAAKTAGKSLLKKIPGVGLIAGLGFGASRLLQGDLMGAGLEVASGAAGTIPGIGTAASIGLDAALAAKDINKEIKENNQTLAQEKDTKKIKDASDLNTSKEQLPSQQKESQKTEDLTLKNIKESDAKKIRDINVNTNVTFQPDTFNPLINFLSPSFANMNNNMEYIKNLLASIDKKINNSGLKEEEMPSVVFNPPPIIAPQDNSFNIPKSSLSRAGGSIKAYREEVIDNFQRNIIV